MTIFAIDKRCQFLFGDGVFLKKNRPQTDFYLSLLNCVCFYFSFFVVIFGFSNLSLLELWNVFVQFVFLRTFYIRRKRKSFSWFALSSYSSTSVSSSRFSMLFRLMYRVDVLWSSADTVGCRIPVTPSMMRAVLNPTILR